MATKVKVIKDVTVYDGNRTYGLGAVFDYSGGEEAVKKLIDLGYVEKAGAPPQGKPDNPDPAKPEQERPKK
jgi:hypothetical protein